MEARAFLGFGANADEVYATDTKEVIESMRVRIVTRPGVISHALQATLAIPAGASTQAAALARTRSLTNAWVAKYRRSNVTGRASFGNTYSALNAVAGHYNSYGTKYPLPAKRADRVLKELDDASMLLERGR